MINNKLKITLFILFVFVLALSLVTITYASPRKIQWGWVTADAEIDPFAIASHKFAELVEEKTNGKIVVELFPNGQLGNERDMVEGLQLGTLDGCTVANPVMNSFDQSFLVIDLPYMFPTTDIAHKTLDGQAGEMLFKRLESIGIKGLAFAEGGFKDLINNVRPIIEPSDLKGVKLRVMENPAYVKGYEYLGTSPITMPWGEVFTAVQQGVMDGLAIDPTVILSNKYYEVTKYLSLTSVFYYPLPMMASMSLWESLSEEEQEIFKEAAKEAAIYGREQNAQNRINAIDELEHERGMEVNDVDKSIFQELAIKAYDDFKEVIDPEIYELFLKETNK
jgi:TRAP-type transport system periplasmic protein